MVFEKEEMEKLKGMSISEKIAYGSAIGKDLKITKIIGDVIKSGIKRIKQWVSGKEQ